MEIKDKICALAIAAAVACGCSDSLEIHHIATGRGNCTYIVMPDGTTMMIDCGDDPVSGASDHNEVQPMMPDSLHGTSGNIAGYIAGVAPRGKEAHLDYFLLTHFHNDHMSAFDGIADLMDIGKIVDRAYPNYPEYGGCEDLDSYRNAVLRLVESGKSDAETFRVGAADQFVEKLGSHTSPEVEIRNLCACGTVWTGRDDNTRVVYGERQGDENANSCGIRLRWGDFTYLSCGDAPEEMQAALAGICGRCDVVVACHHGYLGSMTDTLCRAAEAQAYVVPTREYWHPSGQSVDNMCMAEMSSAGPVIFCTGLLDSQKENFREQGYAGKFAPAGHVAVKVGGRGKWFRLLVLDASDRDCHVIYRSPKIRCRR